MPSPDHHEDRAESIALLLRVSSEEQRDRETIEIQRDFLQEYCRLYGLEVAQTSLMTVYLAPFPCMRGQRVGGFSRTPKRASSPRSSSTASIGSADHYW